MFVLCTTSHILWDLTHYGYFNLYAPFKSDPQLWRDLKTHTFDKQLKIVFASETNCFPASAYLVWHIKMSAAGERGKEGNFWNTFHKLIPSKIHTLIRILHEIQNILKTKQFLAYDCSNKTKKKFINSGAVHKYYQIILDSVTLLCSQWNNQI